MRPLFIVVVLSLVAGVRERSDLERYTKCQFTANFQIVHVDRLPGPRTYTVETTTGPKDVRLLDGYRVLITYAQDEPFVNLKVEQLAPLRFSAEKQALIANLGVLASTTPGMEKPEERRVGPFQGYGITRKDFAGNVLSTYELFNDRQHIVTSIYLLNDDPAERKFQTIQAYRELRDDFLKEYGTCAADAAK